MESTKTPSLWEKIWNERDVQIMVLISLALQLFLLFAGNIRRWRRVGWLRFLVWLAYLATYSVAASAIGLFSQYEDKYKLRSRESLEQLHTLTMPFLWVPFLLLHLGGPDTITAFSIEDNNLWTRQLINLVVQLGLALYVFWKSFDLLDSHLLAVAIPLFVAGIIKYGERIWALQGGSHDSLDSRRKEEYLSYWDGLPPGIWDLPPPPGDAMASLALNSTLAGRRLLVGRTLFQLGYRAITLLTDSFAGIVQIEVQLMVVLTELGMIYDMLYTKTMVLQGWTGGVFRSVGLVAIVVAFVLFWVNQHLHAYETANAFMTYMLFVAAIFVEIYSIFMVIASPWTRARSNQGSFLCWLSWKLSFFFPSQGLSIPFMGQFNLTDYSLSKKSMPKFISKVSEDLGLEKHWRNVSHVRQVEDMEIVVYIVALLNTDLMISDERSQQLRSQQLELGQDLKYLLTLPLELALFRLHIFTEIHLSTLDGGGYDEMTVLVAECRKLSNYLMYLMAVYPSMLLVGSAAQDSGSFFVNWVRRYHGRLTKSQILDQYVEAELYRENEYRSPFKEPPSVASLKEMKEVWARLLIYAAGKCPMEQHVRQLGNGVELLTVVGLLMMHYSLGDVGRKVELLAPDASVSVPKQEALLFSSQDADFIRPSMASITPVYAFEFLDDDRNMPTSVKPMSLLGKQNLPGPSAPTQFSSKPSTSGGNDEAVLDIEQAEHRRQMTSRSFSASGVVRSPQGQISRSSSI